MIVYRQCHIINIQEREVLLWKIWELFKREHQRAVKENATNILEKLGLNMSTYINMALNQLIIQEGIPFAVKPGKVILYG